jgi:hypothetical protein
MAGVFLCEAWLNKAWAEVNDARKKKQYDKHLAAGHQAPGSKCPSEEPYGICCPCVNANPSSRMEAQKGVGLLMAPPNLLINSLREWQYQIDSNNPNIRMRLLYQATPPKGKTNQFITIGATEKAVPIAAFSASKEDIEFLQNHPDSPELAQYVIVCSRESWNAQVLKKGLGDVRYGRFFRDEFHQEPGENTYWMKYLKELNRCNQDWERPYGWLASGTPCEKGPESMVGVMSLLMHPYEWNEHAFWKNYTPEKLRELQSKLKAFVRSDTNSEEDDDAAEADDGAMRDWNRFLRNIMIQRGRGCLWHGRPIMPLIRVHYYEIEVKDTEIMGKMAQQAYAGLSSKTVSNIKDRKTLMRSGLYNLTRACATFPMLGLHKYRAWDTKDGTTVNLTTVAGMLAAGLFKEEVMFDKKRNLFIQDLDSIIKHSAKMVFIKTIIDEKGLDYRGDPAQVILFTYHNVTAMILFMVSQRQCNLLFWNMVLSFPELLNYVQVYSKGLELIFDSG